ncbi:7-cyano-7-deazaguanine synthase QueC [Candidatus Roizmanbacteria bacterium RIFCSPHIGHO2_02_FULL_39_9]|uniref:7-cyano-7-deazaguanine synthase n=2 Tax=Candidatus Roizmaniibacteriota TaxID=1752723 RepID=A0A1F7I222_9BACT|nr:MAG: 7-cyano-7-deazaguanine synthase QueC [Candidatus Roizmanbacteria bacterium RIFCSPHIGHO2_02_FULL_39_9]OGK37426.1 MAG: 7-cyano-7-deazaguanine synthase QueC [Candidatus Roizmanbacteria bacterium RIFCSPHIGHO2_12_FULL_39_8]
MRKAVVVYSGGMDSSTLLAYVASQVFEVYAISFNYGQRHKKELQYAKKFAKLFTNLVEHKIIDISVINELIQGSSLTTPGIDVPDGHYAFETMKSTVVPNRNAIMLSLACGYAVSLGANCLFVGVHSGDHFIYPDCRPEFIETIDKAFRLGNQGFANEDLRIVAPFMYSTKADIVKLGKQLSIDYSKTWSCYKGGNIHCGRCGTCFERREACILAGVSDPTKYKDNRSLDVIQKEMEKK